MGAARKLSGKETALLIATACSAPPEGRKRWTLDLLADAMVRLTGHEGLSRETVRRRLVEDDLKPWRCAPYGSAPWPIVPPIMPARQITSRLLQLIGIPPSKPGNQDGAMPSGIAPYGLLRTVEHTDAALVKLLAAVSAPEPAIALRRSLRPLADSRLSACWAPHPA